nr:uncharacterized protein LOC127292886 [Lolium perenne]
MRMKVAGFSHHHPEKRNIDGGEGCAHHRQQPPARSGTQSRIRRRGLGQLACTATPPWRPAAAASAATPLQQPPQPRPGHGHGHQRTRGCRRRCRAIPPEGVDPLVTTEAPNSPGRAAPPRRRRIPTEERRRSREEGEPPPGGEAPAATVTTKALPGGSSGGGEGEGGGRGRAWGRRRGSLTLGSAGWRQERASGSNDIDDEHVEVKIMLANVSGLKHRR